MSLCNCPRTIRPAVPASIFLLVALMLGLAEFTWADDATNPGNAKQTDHQASATGREGVVRIGKLVYDQGKTGLCFADGFLAEVARRTDIRVDRNFHQVKLGTREMFDMPFIVMTGSQRFSLSESERANLKRYLGRGGFILASAGCSHAGWARDFRTIMSDMFADASLKPLKQTHPIFHQIFEIKSIKLRRAGSAKAVQGLILDDRLAVVFSPMGLNDTTNAGKGCCCCGGNELLNAKAVNTNVLLYALTH